MMNDEGMVRSSNQSVRWSIAEHTKTAYTDAFGTLEFSVLLWTDESFLKFSGIASH